MLSETEFFAWRLALADNPTCGRLPNDIIYRTLKNLSWAELKPCLLVCRTFKVAVNNIRGLRTDCEIVCTPLPGAFNRLQGLYDPADRMIPDMMTTQVDWKVIGNAFVAITRPRELGPYRIIVIHPTSPNSTGRFKCAVYEMHFKTECWYLDATRDLFVAFNHNTHALHYFSLERMKHGIMYNSFTLFYDILFHDNAKNKALYNSMRKRSGVSKPTMAWSRFPPSGNTPVRISGCGEWVALNWKPHPYLDLKPIQLGRWVSSNSVATVYCGMGMLYDIAPVYIHFLSESYYVEAKLVRLFNTPTWIPCITIYTKNTPGSRPYWREVAAFLLEPLPNEWDGKLASHMVVNYNIVLAGSCRATASVNCSIDNPTITEEGILMIAMCPYGDPPSYMLVPFHLLLEKAEEPERSRWMAIPWQEWGPSLTYKAEGRPFAMCGPRAFYRDYILDFSGCGSGQSDVRQGLTPRRIEHRLTSNWVGQGIQVIETPDGIMAVRPLIKDACWFKGVEAVRLPTS